MIFALFKRWGRKRTSELKDEPTPQALKTRNINKEDIPSFEGELRCREDEWDAFIPEEGDIGFYLEETLIGYAKITPHPNSNHIHVFATLEEVNLLPDYRGHQLHWGKECAKLAGEWVSNDLSLTERSCRRFTLDMEAASRGGVHFCQVIATTVESLCPHVTVTTRVFSSPSEVTNASAPSS